MPRQAHLPSDKGSFKTAAAVRDEAHHNGQPVNEYSGSLCVPCKGTKLLCGKDRCPLLVKYHARMRTFTLLDRTDLQGTSPPSVFVGSYGYPKVAIGPLVPPMKGDTALLDQPERWLGRTIDEIVDFRSQLVRGMHTVHIMDVEGGGRIAELTREMALANDPTDADVLFSKRPQGNITLNDEVQPHGPSAPLKALDIGSLKIDHRIEKATNDTDWKAREAVNSLYRSGIPVSKLQRCFSVGAFGIEKNRRYVPTRWSITAVDSTLGEEYMKEVKRFPLINEFRIYETQSLDNRWEVLMLPTSWRYELMEAWYPNTVWNPMGRSIVLIGDHEGYHGRNTYASIGGCYYAARLAVSEHLTKERRQAGVTILREAHPGYIMPVGVWNVRENVRAALRAKPLTFATMAELLEHVSTKMDIPLSRWIRRSNIIHDMLYQRRIEDFSGA